MDKPAETEAMFQPVDAIHTPRDWQTIGLALVTTALIVIACMTLVGLVVGAVFVYSPQVWAARMLGAAGWLVACATGIGTLVAFLLVLRTMRTMLDQTRSLDQRMAAVAERVFLQSTAQANRPDGQDGTEVRRLLGDIREILLLPEAQRAARFRTLAQAEERRRLAAANQYIDVREFHRAREELASLADRFGQTDELRRVQERLVAATRAALQEDIEVATRKVADLMMMARWEQAEQYARELTQKYPDATEPRQLLDRVREERKLFDQRHRQRMHDEIQQFVHQRRWREAASAADMFIQTFPSGVDTDALRQQLETLKANAEIEIRQQLERHIKEYIQRKDYWDALELARRIIAEYPFSPQANVLRMQLPKLEELARQQGPRV